MPPNRIVVIWWFLNLTGAGYFQTEVIICAAFHDDANHLAPQSQPPPKATWTLEAAPWWSAAKYAISPKEPRMIESDTGVCWNNDESRDMICGRGLLVRSDILSLRASEIERSPGLPHSQTGHVTPANTRSSKPPAPWHPRGDS
ncbi:hypothetical protein BDV26DRAFT_272960 [Aspergillus bertholletiae]|uniref:Secreted protein n=1 Tax=Aspergillus bertholletiae TaxID=1226010 RepID=A0A5N7AT51_9EURO|nr:hypothetical protein BDV26DRAFT_272960 [Aspergillus bertholletiae]